jgi:hypothetical protein
MASLQLSERYHLQAWGRLRKPLHILPRSPERVSMALEYAWAKNTSGPVPGKPSYMLAWFALYFGRLSPGKPRQG